MDVSQLLEQFCSECLSLYAFAKLHMRLDDRQEILGAVRLLRLWRDLPEDQRDKMERLQMLLLNGSPRAGRLIRMAAEGQLDLDQLLAVI